MEASIFKTLSSISVKDKIERKGNLDYLSWANAWSVLKQHYPNAQRVVYEHEQTGFNYFTDGRTAWVKVGIIVEGIEHIDYLPIMDFRNNPIHAEKVTSTEVNKTIQRSTAKAIAMHGLGLSLWTGEDVPEQTTQPPVEEAKKETLKAGTDAFEKVSKYIQDNKEQGFDKLLQQVSRKYTITPAIKKVLEGL